MGCACIIYTLGETLGKSHTETNHIPEPAKFILSNSINLLTTSPCSSSTLWTNFLLLTYLSIFTYSASSHCHHILISSICSKSLISCAVHPICTSLCHSSWLSISCLLLELSTILEAKLSCVMIWKGLSSSIFFLRLLCFSLGRR